MSYDLSIIIPARCEKYLSQTIADIIKHKEGKTEVIAVLDGEWPEPAIEQHPDVTVVYFNKSIGQRAATNQGVRISKAKYVIKTDAHCSFDQGFDVKLMADMQDNWTMVPLMKHLHVLDWKCDKCGNTWDQGSVPYRCYTRTGSDGKGKVENPNCDSTSFSRVEYWEARKYPINKTYRFDNTLHFQYAPEFADREELKINDHLVESMSIQGSFFMLTRERYWGLNICDERHGSWGQQGTEVSCKTWLSGGRVVINKNTWYAHLFRTQGGEFSFPYPNPEHKIREAREYSRDIWFNNKFEKQIYPLKWLIDKFSPVRGWEDEDIQKLSLTLK